MKNVLLSLVLVLGIPVFLGAQVVDTAAVIREVDSLIQLSRTFTAKRDFINAMQENSSAEQIALNYLGEESLGYGNVCFNFGRIFYFNNEYKDAELWYLKSRNIRLKILGREHTDYAWCQNNLGLLYKETGNIEESEKLLLESKKIRENVLGKDSPQYLSSLKSLASLYSDVGNYKEAEVFLVEVKNIAEKKSGKMSYDYAVSLGNIANLYSQMGKNYESEAYYIESHEILKQTVDESHPDYLASLDNLALLCIKKNYYEKAERLCIEAKQIREKKLGDQHPDYAVSLSILGTLYYSIGDFNKAEKNFTNCMLIRQKTVGATHPAYASSLNNLAALYLKKGEIEKAEFLFWEAKKIRESVLGKEHPDYANSLNNIAALYLENGFFKGAEALFLEAQNIQLKILDKEHSDYITSINNLAVVNEKMGNLSKSISYLKEANELLKKSKRDNSLQYANNISLLGIINERLGDFSKAESLYLESINIRRNLIGVSHADYASEINNLADLYRKSGRFMEANKLFEESLSILSRTVGEEKLDFIVAKINKSKTLWQTSKVQLAYNSLNESVNLLKRNAIKRSMHFSERELTFFLSYIIDYWDLFYSLEYQKMDNYGDIYDNVLFINGFLIEAVFRIRNLGAFDSNSNTLYSKQKTYNYLLISEYAKPIAERDSARIAEWEEKANTIEKELVRTVAGYGELVRQVSWEEVKQQLRPDEAAVELVSYRYYTPEPTDSTMYAALVLLPGDTSPHFIPLFEERQLQALLHPPDLEEEFVVKKLYSSNSELLNLLWKPLEQLLRDVKTIYYSPAGLLHRVNPAALRDVDKQPLSARHQWVRVGSTRELVTGRLANRSFAQDTSATLSAAVWGGITYEMDSTAFSAANPLDPTAEPLQEYQRKDGKFRYMVEDGTPALSTGTRSAGEEGWSALAGSALEAKQIGTLLQNAGFRTEVFTHYTASEERFKTLGQAKSSPRILHVATHGFAYPDPKKEPERNLSVQEPVYKLQDDPMLRSGLILAGANHYWAAKRPLQDREDGVLVAYEVRDLNLRNTELAVLSACQTGLGDVVGSEGVYGLQRAFRIAGAKFLIVSLWEIPDDKTRELMQLFYENWVNKRESLRDAFNHAQETFRAKEPNPYNWAGFVLIE